MTDELCEYIDTARAAGYTVHAIIMTAANAQKLENELAAVGAPRFTVQEGMAYQFCGIPVEIIG